MEKLDGGVTRRERGRKGVLMEMLAGDFLAEEWLSFSSMTWGPSTPQTFHQHVTPTHDVSALEPQN